LFRDPSTHVAQQRNGTDEGAPSSASSFGDRQPVIVTSGRASSMLWAGSRTSFPWREGCRLRLARRLTWRQVRCCLRCNISEAAFPETLVAWVWAPVLLPNLGGPGP